MILKIQLPSNYYKAVIYLNISMKLWNQVHLYLIMNCNIPCELIITILFLLVDSLWLIAVWRQFKYFSFELIYLKEK